MEELKTTIIKYEDGIYAIDQQMVRAFLIVGEKKAVLLDTGAVRVDIMTFVRQITDLPVELYLTHGDSDHLGNLQDFSTAFINEADMGKVRFFDEYKNVELNPVHENDEINLGRRKLKVIFTPGHTDGSVCFLDEENKILFSGDTISYGPIFMFGVGRDMDKYLASLKKLKAMNDANQFNKIYCCHNICPVPLETIDDLIQCVQGIKDGSIKATVAKIPMQTEKPVYICKQGNCGILVFADTEE